MPARHREGHPLKSIAWLRAAVLGANDGIVSTSSLVLGVAAAHASNSSLLIAAAAGLVGGAMSMAAGEYVSVRSQADTEGAALDQERVEIERNPAGELRELAQIYIGRGLDARLARKVAEQLMTHDALGAHARDELGIAGILRARPLQAALASACSFAAGAALPLAVAALGPERSLIAAIAGGSLIFLGLLGGFAAYVGDANIARGALRVMSWSALAMGVTAGTGALLGAALAS